MKMAIRGGDCFGGQLLVEGPIGNRPPEEAEARQGFGQAMASANS